MKFYVFKWWEAIVKPVIYISVFLLTIVSIWVFFLIDANAHPYYVFIAPILYALLLFVDTVLLGRIQKYVDENLYNRKNMFLSIINLKSVVNATINKVIVDDFEDAKSKILMFQLLTGRDDKTLEALSKGENELHWYIKENGFTYQSQMLTLENKVLKLTTVSGHKKMFNRLIRCYQRSCRRLERNYCRLINVYGGAIENMIDHDDEVTSTKYVLNDLVSKIESIEAQIDALKEKAEIIEDIVDIVNDTMHMVNSNILNAIEKRLDSLEIDIDNQFEDINNALKKKEYN